MDYLVIDRFEGEFAVCEKADRTTVQIPRGDLPANAKEGDLLHIVNGVYLIDEEETRRQRAANRDLFNQLLKKKDI